MLSKERQKREREQRRLEEVAARKQRELMATLQGHDEPPLDVGDARGGHRGARHSKLVRRVRTTPQRKPKTGHGRKRQFDEEDESFLGLRLRCPHCQRDPIDDAAVDGVGNVGCFDCLRDQEPLLAPVTRLRRSLEPDGSSPFDADPSSWMRQSDNQAAASRGEAPNGFESGWGGDLSGDDDDDNPPDQSPSTSAIDKLLAAAEGASDERHDGVSSLPAAADVEAAALLFTQAPKTGVV